MNRLVRQLVGRTRISCIAPDTARDQVVSPALQASMVAAMPVRLEQTLDTGHAPFVTNPDGVAAAIEAAIRQ